MRKGRRASGRRGIHPAQKRHNWCTDSILPHTAPHGYYSTERITPHTLATRRRSRKTSSRADVAPTDLPLAFLRNPSHARRRRPPCCDALLAPAHVVVRGRRRQKSEGNTCSRGLRGWSEESPMAIDHVLSHDPFGVDVPPSTTSTPPSSLSAKQERCKKLPKVHRAGCHPRRNCP